MNFQKIPPVETSSHFLDLAFRKAREKGKLKKLHSVSINISYRITLEFYISEKEIILVNVGHHDDVY